MEHPPWYHEVTEEEKGERIDLFIVQHIPSLSRSQVGKLIDEGNVTVNGSPIKKSYRLRPKDRVEVVFPPPELPTLQPEPIPLHVIYEDEHIIVVDKPPGLVVHPGAGHRQGTLVHGLLHHCKELAQVGDEARPGIVHRLDKDTSGLIIVAKTEYIHRILSEYFKERKIEKIYLAIVYGEMPEEEGTIALPIGRHPRQRKLISPLSRHPRPAITQWKVREKFPFASLLEVFLRTGRTHQIRVHLNETGHPIVGDPTYGQRKEIRRQAEIVWKKNGIKIPNRQLLHAHRLRFTHPASGTQLDLTSPMPADMTEFCLQLRESFYVPV